MTWSMVSLSSGLVFRHPCAKSMSSLQDVVFDLQKCYSTVGAKSMARAKSMAPHDTANNIMQKKQKF
jgi:hypothetical protein